MPSVADFERLARDFVAAFGSQDFAALTRLNQHYRRAYTFDDLGAEVWRRVYAYRQRSSRVAERYLLLDEAQTLVAQDAGYPSWPALTRGITSGIPGVPAYAIDLSDHGIAPRRQLDDHDWDSLIATMAARQIPALDSRGLMTNHALARVAELPHVTSLSLAGSRQLDDTGIQHLARMPQLERLDLSGTKVTSDGLKVLRALPNLRSFELTWHQGISDDGISHLRACDRLRQVNLMGSAVGDGLIQALAGKPLLQDLKTGKLVTDAGLHALHGLPQLVQGEGACLLIDGPFTDTGLASLAGLDAVTELDLFWHCDTITAAGFAHLLKLPNLTVLGADGALSNDVSMAYMALMPQLRKLRAQEAAATDAGFEALSRSLSLESLWGRECRHFSSRGFLALSRMPTLRELGIGCASVDDDALRAFPRFPALSSLTPIGVTDSGFRHIGRCARLDRLTCMYCRSTTDAATEHIADLRLRYYYAGLTQITDRSLEILGRMSTLEQVEFYETQGITDAGLVHLAALPHLREIAIDSAPHVTLAGTAVFPPSVRVRYST